jgi:hypothetical protein
VGNNSEGAPARDRILVFHAGAEVAYARHYVNGAGKTLLSKHSLTATIQIRRSGQTRR